MAVSDCGNRTSFCFENKYKLHKIENDNLCFVKRSVLHFYGNSLAWFSSILQEMVAASSDANQSGGFVWIAEYIQQNQLIGGGILLAIDWVWCFLFSMFVRTRTLKI